jgi:hypothetical protein
MRIPKYVEPHTTYTIPSPVHSAHGGVVLETLAGATTDVASHGLVNSRWPGIRGLMTSELLKRGMIVAAGRPRQRLVINLE